MTFFVEICISKIFASIDNCSSLRSHFLKMWNSHIIIVFTKITWSWVLLILLFFKFCISNQFVTIDISTSERSFNSQYWKLWYHYCFFFTLTNVFVRAFNDVLKNSSRVHEGFLWLSSLKFAFQIYLSRSIIFPHCAIIFINIGSLYLILVFFPLFPEFQNFLEFQNSREPSNITSIPRIPGIPEFQMAQWYDISSQNSHNSRNSGIPEGPVIWHLFPEFP